MCWENCVQVSAAGTAGTRRTKDGTERRGKAGRWVQATQIFVCFARDKKKLVKRQIGSLLSSSKFSVQDKLGEIRSRMVL